MHTDTAVSATPSLKKSKVARLIIADDHCMVAEGIERLLVDDFELLEVASDGEALLAAVRRENPDVVISDISMPGMSGLDVLKQLRSEGSRVPFIFLTMHAEPALAAAAMRAGANGYVLKYAAGKDLVAAVRQVLSGGVYVTPSLGARYLSSQLQEIHNLTVKQREVLRLVGRGLRSKQIAADLGLSVRTV
jgi:DNA-binding NarL/FixJ family response regulator